ncbi:Cytochrome P450 E-class CYP52 [Penicillium malachiteum]|uniref:Cytochrome P450 E-class CYP52 n=1 Tax=Penicillium malachiteum TaxID=1324776 RepID=UPI0025495F0D|nr:Cytochrome P450 E-class CYP52 [Penicillium malachiteum]KAJ5737455.1 Cytochrome P450 E-class CYP52 [Penicillium malachiteum]
MNVRVAAKTTVIPSGGGPDGRSPLLIPKGTGVGYSVYHMHRLRSLYGKDANEFRPERWLDQELEDIGWGFMPFHGGSRICLGKELALEEASCAIIRILQAFPGLKLPPGTSTVPPGEEKQTLTIVVMSADGCKSSRLGMPDLRLDEMQLKLYRKLSFQLVFENDQMVYKHATDPPLDCITCPVALENAKPYCVGDYR